MTTERWHQVRDVFERALDLPEAHRPAFLDAACEADADLRARVERLLDAHVRATGSGFFDTPVVDRVAAAPADPERVGPYRIVRRLAGGGMGTVYLAERGDEQYHKRVAIKLIRPGFDTEEILRRFRYERQILAALDHPNIARLLDGGVMGDRGGRPYIVMEYVDGVPIDRYCTAHGLSIDRRLALFRAVCEAVQYAHQNLVVHRDLKPGNILVREDGTVKLLDFGIAKLLDPAAAGAASLTVPVTRAGLHVMTPAYASPEQVQGGPITTATDVYSLGVILYELLTGHKPFDVAGATPAGIERTIVETVPVAPSEAVRGGGQARELRRRLAGDLDNIVLMALRKEPQRRYASVEQLSEDLRRHALRLPVIARPDTFSYRTSRFVRRNRGKVIAAALIFLALTAGFAGTAWQATVAARQRDRARVELAKGYRIIDFLQSMLASADPLREGRDVTVAEVLDDAARRLDTDLADQPEVRAALRITLGATYRELGLFDRAEDQLTRGLETRRQLMGDLHPDVARALNELGSLYHDTGHYTRAEKLLREAVATYEALPQTDSLALARALNDLAVLRNHEGDEDEAEHLYRRVLGIYRRHLDKNDHRVASVLNNLGVLVGTKGDVAAAEAMHREALGIMREEFPGDHPTVAYTLYNLAGVLDIEGKYAEAEPLYREALAMRRRLYGDEHPDVISSTITLANLLWLEKDYDSAEPLARQALSMAEKVLPEGHPLIAYADLVTGQILTDAGRPVEAEPFLRKALALREALLPSTHWLVANTRSVLGGCLARQGRYAEAEPLLVGSYEQLEADRGPAHEKTRDALRRVIALYEAWGKAAQAMAYREAVVAGESK